MKKICLITAMALLITPLMAQKYFADNEVVIAYPHTSNGTHVSYGVYGLKDYKAGDQIIADHTIVDYYDNIPSLWIDIVKTMLVDIAGESHSAGYRKGANLLEDYDVTYQAFTYAGSPPAYSNSYLRLGKHATVGEANFYTTQNAIDTYKDVITDQYDTGNPFDVMGFGWCWDMSGTNAPGGTIDPVYNVRWAGASVGGADGNQRWGLDSGDSILTGNRVNMDTYLDAVEQYIQHCTDNSYSTKVIFTTGPVDNVGGTESGFQREIKHDYIRDYVAADASRILFDYADILCWNNNGEQNTEEWDDNGTPRTHAHIHDDNTMDYDDSWNLIAQSGDGDHIGEVGALRLGKAMWWMLARIAGWDGGQVSVPVSTINVSSAGGVSEMLTGNTLQFTAEVLPADATNKGITWNVSNQTGQGTITQGGMLTAVAEGTVNIVATAQDGSGVTGSMQLTITDPTVLVTSISVSSAGGVTEMSTGGDLQFTEEVLPANATNKSVTWSVTNQTGQGTITQGGLLTAVAAGTVDVIATAQDGSGINS